MTSRQVRLSGADGLTIAADEWGDREHQAVLLLHGGGQTRHSWKSAGAELAAAGRHVVSADLRGHGDSDWSPDARYGFEAHRDDVLSYLPQITDGPLVLVGASLGGLTSLLVTQHRPDLVRALVLVDVVVQLETTGTNRIREFMFGNRAGFDSLEQAADAIAAYLPHRPRPKSTDGLRKNLRQREDGRWYWHWDPAMTAHPEAADEALQRKTWENLDEIARSITVPTLLIQGGLSDVVSDEGVQHFRELVPHLEVATIAGAGHTAAADDNDAFTAAVSEFVARVSG
ncbi:alpha/beta hydrolase [Enemella dayhoffiae]|uniref:Alpha/beta hydrolase n=1 Tax=Enemella dayhoffiae TaxID=2016507 RepID=A0A255GUD9_9ACTN|nr:alpha/beta hydrolase [Enemella dayhoffiae]OYO18396.1 alpha/beta hydrolase [Enemella dayhoffiae]